MIKDLDFTDSKQKRLAGFAGRIVRLLEKPDVQRNEPLASVLDDLLGAVYALIAARQENFKGKMGKSEFAPILDRAKLISTGKPKNSGNWMAGFQRDIKRRKARPGKCSNCTTSGRKSTRLNTRRSAFIEAEKRT